MPLLRLLLAAATLLPLLASAAENLEETPPAAHSPSRVARLYQLREQVEAALKDFDQRLTKPKAEPTVRDLTAAGYLILALKGDVSHAEELFRSALAMQQMDAAAPNFGDVPWQIGHTEIQDANSIEFTMLGLAGACFRYRDKLSPVFQAEARAHLIAALAAIRRHRVKPAYTNIYTMKTANLLMLGETLGDASAVRDGVAALDEWLAFTRTNGLAEYDSPTYTLVDLECLGHAFAAAPDEPSRAKVRAGLDFIWADLAASFFAPSQALTGPMSRTYDFLYHRGSIDRAYFLNGLKDAVVPEKPLDTYWIDAQFGKYEPSRKIRDLAHLPERVVHARFGPEPGRDRTLWITPDFAIGSTSAFYGPQNVELSVEFATQKKLPATWVVLDPFDAPYGRAKTRDRSGHSKPKLLKNILAAVQDHGTVLALHDQSPEAVAGEGKTLSTNVILPVAADAFYLDGERLKLPGDRRPFDFPLMPTSTVCVREGSAILAVRIFAADGLDGKPAPLALRYDGNEWGAARVVAMHATDLPATKPTVLLRAGVFLHIEHCTGDPGIADFLKRTKNVEIHQTTQGGVWSASVELAGAKLEAGLDLHKKTIALRRVNGQDVRPVRLTVNGRDLAAEILGDAPAEPEPKKP